MHVEYRVSFQDSDWVVAQRHKLILSVFIAIEIGRDRLVYVAIRFGKHSSLTALAQGLDLIDC